MADRTIACVVRAVDEGGVLIREGQRVITSVDVRIESTDGTGALRATVAFLPADQPRVGDHFTITIAPKV